MNDNRKGRLKMIKSVKSEHNVLPQIYSAMETVEVLNISYKTGTGNLTTVVGTVHFIDFSNKEIRLVDYEYKVHYIKWVNIKKID